MWYVATFAVAVTVCALASVVCRDTATAAVTPAHAETASPAFQRFRRTYLTVYLLNMLGDWLQGPYVYALYQSYGYGLGDIAGLFVVGFLSSAVVGTMVGSIADHVGRKKMGMVFSLTYSASCVTKLFPQYRVLLLGRILSGISTSLLFSVFEAWMVREHETRGFSKETLSDIFSWAVYGNGFVAIVSGVLAYMLRDRFGLVAPFVAGIGFFLTSAVVVATTWNENYGHAGETATKVDAQADMGLFGSLKQGVHCIRNDFRVFAIGSIQSLFEGSMYTFVFMWSPTLKAAANITRASGIEGDVEGESELPFGIIFSCFMVSLMIGSIGFRVMSKRWKMSEERILEGVLMVASATMIVPVFCQVEYLVNWGFNVFEVCCGIYFPCIGVLRGKYIPEAARATVMNLFRIPLNLIVVVVLLKVSKMQLSTVFLLCALLLFTGFLLLTMLRSPTDAVTIHGSRRSKRLEAKHRKNE